MCLRAMLKGDGRRVPRRESVCAPSPRPQSAPVPTEQSMRTTSYCRRVQPASNGDGVQCQAEKLGGVSTAAGTLEIVGFGPASDGERTTGPLVWTVGW